MNKHKSCGGKFVKDRNSDTKTFYTCNKCGKELVTYKKKKGGE